jgi:hydrogenase-4 component B
MLCGMALPAAACIAIGVWPGIVLGPLGTLAQELIPGGVVPVAATAMFAFLPWVAVFILVAAAAWLLLPRNTRVTPTWGCGLSGLNSRMQYTSTSFSKPLRTVFARVYKPDRSLEILPIEQPCFPASISYRSVRTTSFERSLYRPVLDAVVGMARRLRRMQTGNIQVYLLYMFLALVAALIYMRLT